MHIFSQAMVLLKTQVTSYVKIFILDTWHQASDKPNSVLAIQLLSVQQWRK